MRNELEIAQGILYEALEELAEHGLGHLATTLRLTVENELAYPSGQVTE
jgi:hypothetical protein